MSWREEKQEGTDSDLWMEKKLTPYRGGHVEMCWCLCTKQRDIEKEREREWIKCGVLKKVVPNMRAENKGIVVVALKELH